MLDLAADELRLDAQLWAPRDLLLLGCCLGSASSVDFLLRLEHVAVLVFDKLAQRASGAVATVRTRGAGLAAAWALALVLRHQLRLERGILLKVELLSELLLV